MSAVLVTGGAGYIGSHVAWRLADEGRKVVVLDDLSTGNMSRVPPAALFFRGKVSDGPLVRDLLRGHDIGAVIHLAGSINPSESLTDPLAYYQNNTAETLALLAACAGRIRAFLFSSTAAVYAPGDGGLIAEGDRLDPATPYGQSKLMSERIIADLDRVAPFPHMILRYFNVAGCDPEGRTGDTDPPRQLVQLACAAAAQTDGALSIFGQDYPTPDGACIRDYIHVADLADIHARALDHLLAGGESTTLNCGYARGISVLEVVEAVRRVSGRPLATRIEARRPGDLANVVADVSRMTGLLGWSPSHANLDDMVRSTLRWRSRMASTDAALARDSA